MARITRKQADQIVTLKQQLDGARAQNGRLRLELERHRCGE